MIEKIVMISKQMATAIAVIAVRGESSRSTKAPLLPSDMASVLWSRNALRKILSDPITVRRLPAVDALLHSPAEGIKRESINNLKEHLRSTHQFPYRNDNSSRFPYRYYLLYLCSGSRARTGYSTDPGEGEQRNLCTSIDRVQSTRGTSRGNSGTFVLLSRNIVS